MNTADSIVLSSTPSFTDSYTELLNPPPRKWPPIMWLNTDRFLYLGVLGQPQGRCFGALALYLSLQGAQHRIRIGDKDSDWQQAQLSIVQPWCHHWLAFDDRAIGCMLLLEPETLKFSALPAVLRQSSGALTADDFAERMYAALEELRDSGVCRYGDNSEFDLAFFGEPLAAPRPDGRIQKVLQRIKSHPNSPLGAQECAERACLSPSRFLHLFKEEVGAPFRSYRAWQRARSLLYHVKDKASLTDIALNYGYPDATHFSHSIRRFAGMTPKVIHSGSRKVALFVSGAGALKQTGGAE